ncbi:MAG TPA: response regulator [Thermodesulfovibrionales bacterium]|nr:response regulator [Thermodesulfovibrionales bacterium]
MRNRILVADASQSFLVNVGILLSRMGFKVIPVENGVEVLKLIKLSGPDIVMLDTNLAVMDGITVLKHIKGDRQTAKIPVIMTSDHSSSGTLKKCKSLGCSAYLLKPLSVAGLHEIIQKTMFSDVGTNRRHVRAAFIRKVVITYKRRQYELYAETLSQGGIYVRRMDPFPEGAEVDVELPLKGEGSLSLKGVVIYTKGLFGDVFKVPPGMAIEFKGLTKRESKTLRDYVENLIAEDILENQGASSITR